MKNYIKFFLYQGALAFSSITKHLLAFLFCLNFKRNVRKNDGKIEHDCAFTVVVVIFFQLMLFSHSMD